MVLAMRLRLSGDRSPRPWGLTPGVLGSRARDPKRSSSGSEVTTTRVSPGVPSMKSDALLAQWTGTSRSKTERSGQSYGLERSTTALRSKTGKKDRS